MNCCHTWPGSFAPYIGRPFALKIGWFVPLPTQTAALTCGVKPTSHASLLFGDCGEMPSVPVLAADLRPFASGTPE